MSNFDRDKEHGTIGEIEVKNFIEERFGLKSIINESDKKNRSEMLEELRGWDVEIQIENPIKIEVKTDREAYKTFNIAVEDFCWGKPSGLATTKSPIWIYKLDKLNEFLVMRTDNLKKLVKDKKYFYQGMKGDKNQSHIYLFKNEIIRNISIQLKYFTSIEQFKKLSRVY